MAAPDFLFTMSARLDGAVASAFAQFERQGGQAATRVREGVTRLNRETSTTAERFRTAAAAAGVFQGALGGVSSRLNSSALLFQSAGAGIATTLGLIAGAAASLGALSGIQNYQARLKAATKTEEEFGAAQALTSRVAKDSRSSLNDTIAFYTRLSAGTRELGLSQQTLGSIISVVQKSIQLSGAGAAEAAAAQTQFIQGLTSANGLSGDEFKSLGENAVVVLQSIADGLKKTNAIPGFDGSIQALRKLGTQGQLTASVLAPALLAIKSQVDDTFSRFPVTIEQATTLVKNSFTEMVVSVEKSTGILAGSANGIALLSSNLRAVGGVATLAGAAIAVRFIGPMIAAGVASLSTGANLVKTALGAGALAAQARNAGAGATALALQEEALGRVMAAANVPLAEQAGILLRLRVAAASGAAGLGTLDAATIASRATMTGLKGAASGLLGLFGGPWGLAFTAAAGAAYYLSTQESLAEKAAATLGIQQGQLAAAVLAATGRIIDQNSALAANINLATARGRAEAQDKINSAKSDEADARTNLAARIRSAALTTNTPGVGPGKFFDVANLVETGASVQTITKALDALQAKSPGAFRQLKTLFGVEINKDINSVADQLAIAATRTGALEKAYADAQKGTADAVKVTAAATNTYTRAQLNAKAAVDGINSSTPALIALKRRETLELTNLAAAYAKTKKHTDAEQSAYEEQRAAIVSNYDQQTAAVKEGEAAKRAAATAARTAARSDARHENAEDLAEARDAIAANEKLDNINRQFGTEPSRSKQIDKASTDALEALYSGGDINKFMESVKTLYEYSLKAQRDVNEAAREQTDIQALTLQGREADAEVLRRSLDLLKQTGDASKVNVDSIASQVNGEIAMNAAIEKRTALIEIQARSAGEVQSALRDAIRGFEDGKIGSTFKNLGKSLSDSFKNQIADTLSTSIFGNAEDAKRKELTGALGTTTDGLYAVRDALLDYQKSLFSDGGTGALGGSQGIASLGTSLGASVADGLGSLFSNLSSSPLSGASSAGAVTSVGSALIPSGAVSGFAGSGLGLIAGLANVTSRGINGVATTLKDTAKGGGLFGAGNAAAANFNKIGEQFGGKLDKFLGSGSIFGTIGSKLGTALQGAGQGAAASGIAGSLGLKQSNTGAQIGGAIGSLIPALGPFGGIIGGLVGGTIGGLFKKTPKSYTSASVDASGNASAGSTKTSGKGDAAASQATAGSLVDAINSLAQSLGGTLKPGSALGSIGNYKGKPDFIPAGQVHGASYDTPELAVAAALKSAIQNGVVLGIRQGTKNLLLAGNDFTAQVAKATKFEAVFTDLKAALDPVGAATDAVNKKFADLKNIFAEAGASAADYAALQQLYDIQTKDAIKAATVDVSSTLKDFLSSLTTGADTGLSIRDRDKAATAAFKPFADDIAAGKKVDQDAYTAAANTLLASDRELYGSTQQYFDRLNQITALTRKAIGDQTNVTSISAALDLKGAVAPVTASIGTLQAALLAQGVEGNTLLLSIVGKLQGATGGGGPLVGTLATANRY